MNASFQNNLRKLLVLTFAVFPLGVHHSVHGQRVEPINRIVVMVDGSGSYKARQEEALVRALDLLEKVAATKVKRTDDSVDRVAVLSLDAMPEILWEGTLRDLKKIDPKTWVQRFKSRSDYARCTDVTKAFTIAAGFIERDANYGGKYIFAFTDMLHEPPMGAIGKCRRPEAVASDFPWDAVRGVAIDVLWVPADQKLLWERAAEKHAIQDLKLHTSSESAFVTIKAPSKATKSERIKRAERDDAAGRMGGLLGDLGRMATILISVAVAVVLSGVAVFLVAILFRRRSASGRGTRSA